MNNSVDTVNAAATAIVSAEARVQPPTPPVGSLFFFLLYSIVWFCFGTEKVQ